MHRRGGTMGDDNWQADLAGLSRLQVDVEHLGNIKAYLDQVADAIKQDLRPYVFEVNRLATTGGDESRSALGGTEIREVGDLAKRIEGTFQAVDNTLKSMAEALQRDGEAVQKIAEKYRAADERNAATAMDFTTALNG
jgi:t-SNARE complex subunit (syntaxin)